MSYTNVLKEFENLNHVHITISVRAIAKAEEEGLTYIHPFDDPYVIAGQGTVGVEILRQCSGALLDSSTGEGAGKDLHAIFVPVGGGGLLAGISSFVKQVRPDVKVYGVEPLGASCMGSSSTSSGE